jgi:predicted metal-dependent phosphotriesterase family hydrolase
VPKCQLELARRGHSAETISKISFDNPRKFLGQSPKFTLA